MLCKNLFSHDLLTHFIPSRFRGNAFKKGPKQKHCMPTISTQMAGWHVGTEGYSRVFPISLLNNRFGWAPLLVLEDLDDGINMQPDMELHHCLHTRALSEHLSSRLTLGIRYIFATQISDVTESEGVVKHLSFCCVPLFLLGTRKMCIRMLH